MRSFVVVAALIFVSQAALAAVPVAAPVVCPLGAKDSELTIQRVMINFGKFTSKADDVVMQGSMSAASVGMADLQNAASDLLIAKACAEAVVQGGSDELLPGSVSKLTGAARDQYVAAFTQAMSTFAGALDDYARALTDLAGSPIKDYTAAIAQKRRVSDMADQAHAHFN